MAGVDAKFTMIAGQAMSFADLFNRAFKAGLSGPVPFHVELTTPVGPSTAGGKQALQHIRLVPTVSGPAIVVGSVNAKDQTAELRSFQVLADNYAARFKGTPIPVDPEAFATLTRRMQELLSLNGFAVTLTTVSNSLPPPAEPAASSSGSASALIAVAIAAIVALLGGGAYLFMHR